MTGTLHRTLLVLPIGMISCTLWCRKCHANGRLPLFRGRPETIDRRHTKRALPPVLFVSLPHFGTVQPHRRRCFPCRGGRRVRPPPLASPRRVFFLPLFSTVRQGVQRTGMRLHPFRLRRQWWIPLSSRLRRRPLWWGRVGRTTPSLHCTGPKAPTPLLPSSLARGGKITFVGAEVGGVGETPHRWS